MKCNKPETEEIKLTEEASETYKKKILEKTLASSSGFVALSNFFPSIRATFRKDAPSFVHPKTTHK